MSTILKTSIQKIFFIGLFLSNLISVQSIFAFNLSNKNASEKAKQVYHYLTTRNSFDSNRLFSGQNCYHGNGIVDGYPEFVEGLFMKTGKYPAFVGVDYEYVKRYSIQELSQTNAVLLKHWKNGGLVTINWAPYNPWTNKDCRDLNSVNLNDLVDPTKTVYKKWHAELDRIAKGLAELRDSGVVVVWRPLQEMNGDWFWWGAAAHPNDNEPFKKMWRDLFNYFSVEKGLNNLIWEVSIVEPVTLHGIDFYYPGDDVIDIVGTSVYKNQYKNTNYQAMLALGKPLAACETGPDHCCMNGSWDNMTMVNGIKNDSPNTMYFLNWHDWPDHLVAIVSNQNASQLMSDSWVITRDEVNWQKDLTNESPSVELVVPASEVIKGSNLLIEAKALDTDGKVVKVQFFNGYERIGEDNEAPYQFEYKDVPSGKLHLNVRAIDDKGAVSVSETIVINSVSPTLPYTNLVLNGEFDFGLGSWSFWGNSGTSFNVYSDNNYNLAGRNSLRAEIINGGNEGWMCQLMSDLELKANVEYVVGFKAKSNKKANFVVQLRQSINPYQAYWQKSVSIDVIPKVFGPFSFKNLKDDKNGQIIFMLGGQKETTIWLDSIVVFEKIVSNISPFTDNGTKKINLNNYPNPFCSKTTIAYNLTEGEHVKIAIHDLNGRELKILEDQFHQAGKYEVEFDGTSFSPGIYLYCFQTFDYKIVDKMMLVK